MKCRLSEKCTNTFPRCTLAIIWCVDTLYMISVNLSAQVLEELIQIQPSREHPIDFSHMGIFVSAESWGHCGRLGTLYILNRKRNGRFLQFELNEFQKLYSTTASKHKIPDFAVRISGLRYDCDTKWKDQFKAYCSLLMWEEISKSGGSQKFVTWLLFLCWWSLTRIRFGKLFSEHPDAVVSFRDQPDVVFLKIDVLKTLYQVTFPIIVFTVSLM